MKLISRLLMVCLGVLAAAQAWAEPRVQHVFIISLDGGKPEVMQKSKMPTLFSMRKQGAGTWEAQTIFPSITLISHTSMLTGVGPAKHKVTWNNWNPERGIVKVPTVFQIADQQKLKAAMFFGKEKFLHLAIPGTLDAVALPGYRAKAVADAAARYIEKEKPNLCFIHFADGDGAGHSYGWGSPQQMKAFEDTDKALGVIRRAIAKAGIANDSVIIISADHGGHAKTHGTNSPEDMTIPWLVWGKGVKRDFAIPEPVTTYDTAATALWLLDLPIPSDWDGKPVLSAFE